MSPKKRPGTEPVSSDGPVAPPPEAPSFEAALEELESVVKKLESEDLTLEGALSSFERGIHLLRRCDTHLNKTRGKIIELFKGEDGAFVEKVLGTSLESFLNEKTSDE
ncbi:MAG: exodeoxyribonuclease VII small subunit [Chitinispirillaceae bacterium]|nr:exodeoxyribonuclease VII small subunit [Chitinispirillaceae bacterium]